MFRSNWKCSPRESLSAQTTGAVHPRAGGKRPAAFQPRHPSLTSSVRTLKLFRVLGPKVLLMATSAGRGAAGDQHASDARDIVASVEGIPVAVKVGLKPGCEIQRAIRRRHADIAQVTGAVTRGDIHTATEGDGEVRVIVADARSSPGKPPRPSSWGGRARNRRRYLDGRNRRLPGRVPMQWATCRRGPKLSGTADRSRNIGSQQEQHAAV